MKINRFKLERYFGKYEFKVKCLLSASDCQGLSLQELLSLADAESKKLWEELKLSYTETTGHPLLREEIGKLHETSPDNTVVTVPEEGIFIALNTLLEKDDEVIITHPVYQSLAEIPRAIGCTVKEWPVTLKNDEWALDINLLESLITKKTKLLVINFPHNPTGYLPSQAEYKSLIELARKYSLYIFSDEMYRYSEYEEDHRLPSMGTVYEKGISLSGLSKSFALPGLRMGWLISGDQNLLNRFVSLKDYTTICHSAPSEILAIIALRAKEAIVRRSLGIIKKNLKLAEDFFSAYSGIFRWLSPQAGSVAFPLFLSEMGVESLSAQVLEKKSTMIVPGSFFGVQGGFFRVGLGRADLPLALAKLREYLEEEKIR